MKGKGRCFLHDCTVVALIAVVVVLSLIPDFLASLLACLLATSSRLRQVNGLDFPDSRLFSFTEVPSTVLLVDTFTPDLQLLVPTVGRGSQGRWMPTSGSTS